MVKHTLATESKVHNGEGPYLHPDLRFSRPLHHGEARLGHESKVHNSEGPYCHSDFRFCSFFWGPLPAENRTFPSPKFIHKDLLDLLTGLIYICMHEDINRNIKRLVYSADTDSKVQRFELSLFLSDEGSTLETLDLTIRVIWFDLYFYTAYGSTWIRRLPITDINRLTYFCDRRFLLIKTSSHNALTPLSMMHASRMNCNSTYHVSDAWFQLYSYIQEFFCFW